MLMLAAANREEGRYSEPDTFDLWRDTPKPHISFGHGPHICLGMHLARMESRVAVNTLFDRLGPFTLDPDVEPPRLEGLAFRSPLSLPVVFSSGR